MQIVPGREPCHGPMDSTRSSATDHTSPLLSRRKRPGNSAKTVPEFCAVRPGELGRIGLAAIRKKVRLCDRTVLFVLSGPVPEFGVNN